MQSESSIFSYNRKNMYIEYVPVNREHQGLNINKTYAVVQLNICW